MKIIKDPKRDETPTSKNEGDQSQFPGWRIVRLLGLLVVLVACLLGYNGYRASLPGKYQNLYHEANQNEDWNNAEFWARKWTEVDNANGDAWLALGDALQTQQKWQELSDALSQFPVDDKRALKILDMRGDLLVSELNDIVEAEANDLKLLKLEPLNASARQRLTYIYSMTLQREKLSQLLRDSVQLQREPQEAYYYLFSLSNLSFSDGLLVTTKWLKKRPESEPLQIAQAIFSVRTKPGKSQSLFEKEGILPGDFSLLEKCKNKYPQNVEIFAYEIYQAMIKNDAETVEKLIEKIDLEKIHDSRIFRYRAWLFNTQGKIKEALANCRKALELNKLDWRIHLDLAELERLSGNKEIAAKHAKLASRGKSIETSFQALKNATVAPFDQLKTLYEYIRDCGEEDLAFVLGKRLNLY